MTGVFAALVGFLIGYIVVKAKGSLLSKLLDQFSFLPYLMPALPFAATYLVLFAHPIGPIPALYGTMALLVLISVVKRLPYSSRAGISSMMQIGKELEVLAMCPEDGLIEAFLWKGAEEGKVMGVQWHPEYFYNSDARLIDADIIYNHFIKYF